MQTCNRVFAAALLTLATAWNAAAQDVRFERLDPRFDALIATDAVAEKVADGLQWSEGPVWSKAEGALLFSDVPRNAIFRWKPGAGVSEFMARSGYAGDAPFKGKEPGSNGLAFDAQERLVICQHGDRRVARREADGRITTLADRYDGKRLNSPNDLAIRANGEVYFTDPPFGLPPDSKSEIGLNGVYRIKTDRKVELLTGSLEHPNGIAFSPDGKTLYVSNSLAERPVWMAFKVLKGGDLGVSRQFADAYDFVGEGKGLPDGLKVDAAGNVFAAGPGGVHVFAADGTRLGRIVTDVPTGNLNWGEDGSVLYIAANHAILRLPTKTKGAPAPLPK